ncbi:MAG: thiol-disulfide isomerase [Phycisphaerae bacterium]|nr:MAG: thiol-disulfide isomerase [Phycisphaerae bacterium]
MASACILAAASLSAAMFAQPPSPRMERSPHEQDPAPLGLGRLIPDFDLAPIEGPPTSLSAVLKGRRGVVLVMTSTTCPVSRRYAPRLAQIEADFSLRGIPFVYVNTVRAETLPEMQRHIRESGFTGLYLPDRAGRLAAALGARTTTEVYVLDASRTLVYRGAVDDQVRVGGVADAPSRHFLRDALASLLAGRPVATPATWAPGCLLDIPARVPGEAGNLTYFGRIARILDANCLACHREGGPGAYPLDHYGAVVSRAAMIEAVVRDDLMPPTHGLHPLRDSQGRRLWKNDRTLDESDKRDLLTWLRSTRPMGDPADRPVRREPSQTWEIGLPDAIYSTPDVAVPAEGPLQHQRIIVPMNLGEARWVSAVECRPMMRETVHHALVWVQHVNEDPGQSVEPSWSRLLATYGPGDGVTRFAPVSAMKLEPGSRLVVDLYAKPMGRPMNASLRVAVRFGEKPQRTLVSETLVGPEFNLPAGHRGPMDLPSKVLTNGPSRITGITPVFGPRCVKVALWTQRPGEERQLVLKLDRYDFRWRLRYEPEEPILLPDGVTLGATAMFDNSEQNPANPDAGRTVVVGFTNDADEPMFIGLELIDESPEP